MSSSRIFTVVSRLCQRSIASIPVLLCLAVLLPFPQTQASEAAWQELRNNGIVLFRHALAPGTGDPAAFDLADCATQRNLNKQGQRDARRIGEAFREQGIKVARVLTSQWCRCRDTANLAFPGLVEEEPIFNSFFENRSAGPAQTSAAISLLAEWRGPGALVIVTHQVNITALTGVFPSSGEGIVVRIENRETVMAGRLEIQAP